jgi:hypothetical protein
MYELHLRHALTFYVYIIGYQPLNAKGVSMNRMKLDYVKFSDDKCRPWPSTVPYPIGVLPQVSQRTSPR